MKSGSYMATRYLQTQHRNKQGKTSGDGEVSGMVVQTSNLILISQVGNRGHDLESRRPGIGQTVQTGDELRLLIGPARFRRDAELEAPSCLKIFTSKVFLPNVVWL